MGGSCHINDKNFWLFLFFCFSCRNFLCVYVCLCVFVFFLVCNYIATIVDDDDDDWRGTDSLRKEGRIFAS